MFFLKFLFIQFMELYVARQIYLYIREASELGRADMHVINSCYLVSWKHECSKGIIPSSYKSNKNTDQKLYVVRISVTHVLVTNMLINHASYVYYVSQHTGLYR